MSQNGRPDDGTDATGFYNAEFFVDLKPYNEWRGFHNKDELINKMNAELSEIPGLNFNFSQNIEDNVEEAVTGVKGELAVKLFGEDLDVLEKKAAEIQDVMSKIKGIVDLSTFTETGEPQVEVHIDRAKSARYGLNVRMWMMWWRRRSAARRSRSCWTAKSRFDVVARLLPDSRSDVEQIRNIALSTPDDQRIPLSQVADVQYGARRFVRLSRGESALYRHQIRRTRARYRRRSQGGAGQGAAGRPTADELLHRPGAASSRACSGRRRD